MRILIHLIVVVLSGMIGFWAVGNVKDGMAKTMLQIIVAILVLVWLVQGWNFDYGIHF